MVFRGRSLLADFSLAGPADDWPPPERFRASRPELRRFHTAASPQGSLCPMAGAKEEVMMQSGLHAFSLSLQRLGMGLLIIVGGVMFALFALVAVVVVGQAAAGFGQ
jgi:hypothetical protein